MTDIKRIEKAQEPCCCAPEKPQAPSHESGCLLCGKPLVYWPEAKSRVCAICGKTFEANCACEDGHFVCDDCHRAGADAFFLPLLLSSTEKDPLKLFEQVVSLPRVHMHGPEHHCIVPCVLLTAYRNNGGQLPGASSGLHAASPSVPSVPSVPSAAPGAPGAPSGPSAVPGIPGAPSGAPSGALSGPSAVPGALFPPVDPALENSVKEAIRRSKQVPGGTCGYWGVCGAAAGAGIYMSILLGSNPVHKDAWPIPHQLVADCLQKLAEVGGPRCCKRTGRLCITIAAERTAEWLGIEMPLSEVRCRFLRQNRECLGPDCPYFPLR